MKAFHTKLSCGIVPVRKSGSGWEFLILRCFNNWDFPKGMKEAKEDPVNAALREFTEETGLTNIKIISTDLFIETPPYNQGKIARYYLGVVTNIFDVKLEPNPITGILEHQKFRWVSYEVADQLVVPRIQKILEWAVSNLQ